MTSSNELIEAIEKMKDFCIEMATGGASFSYEKYELERGKIMSRVDLKGVLPNWLIEARYGTQFWDFIKKIGSYRERKIFLRTEFDQMIDSIKNGYQYTITDSLISSLSHINNESINTQWRKIINRSKTDPEGAITASKSMLETLFKYVLDAESKEYTKLDDFNDLYSKVKDVLNLDPKKHNIKTFKQILAGITSVTQGLGSLRNDYGDSHGKGKNSFYPEVRHAEFVINLTASLCIFLIDTYNLKIKK